MTGPVPLSRALDDYIAELVAAAPPLTTKQADLIVSLLAAPPHTPAPRGASPITSARAAAHGFSTGTRPHPDTDEPPEGHADGDAGPCGGRGSVRSLGGRRDG